MSTAHFPAPKDVFVRILAHLTYFTVHPLCCLPNLRQGPVSRDNADADCMNKKLKRNDYQVETWRDARCQDKPMYFCMLLPLAPNTRFSKGPSEVTVLPALHLVWPRCGTGCTSKSNEHPSKHKHFSKHSEDECSSACFVPGSVWHSIQSFPIPEAEVPL